MSNIKTTLETSVGLEKDNDKLFDYITGLKTGKQKLLLKKGYIKNINMN